RPRVHTHPHFPVLGIVAVLSAVIEDPQIGILALPAPFQKVPEHASTHLSRRARNDQLSQLALGVHEGQDGIQEVRSLLTLELSTLVNPNVIRSPRTHGC